MNLTEATEGKEYIVKQIETDDEELNSFLFSLGCYSGEPITVISHVKGGCVVSIKDGRYNIDNQLASAILIMQCCIIAIMRGFQIEDLKIAEQVPLKRHFAVFAAMIISRCFSDYFFDVELVITNHMLHI